MLPKQSLGQNFLMHRQTAERIVSAADITSEDTVLEIGPGTGMLTKALLAVAQKVIAVETDHELFQKLETDFTNEIQEGKLTLISADARSFDPSTILEEYKLVANIPYYITGELIRKFLSTSHKPKLLTFLVQKEVAVRIARSKKESLLSLSVKVYGTPSYKLTVPKGAFYPAPAVDSAVLSVSDITSPFASDIEESRFFEILHAAFAHKRKQLAKNLEELCPSEMVREALEEVGISPKIRAEDVELSDWHKLAKILVI